MWRISGRRSSRRWSTSRPPSFAMEGSFAAAVTPSSTNCVPSVAMRSSTSPRWKPRSASEPASPRSRCDTTASSATTSRFRSRSWTPCLMTTTENRRSRPANGSSPRRSRSTSKRRSGRTIESWKRNSRCSSDFGSRWRSRPPASRTPRPRLPVSTSCRVCRDGDATQLYEAADV